MTLPGLLIEYLVNGSIALVWVYPVFGESIATLPEPQLPLLIAALYVIGMVIDVSAWIITWPLKDWVRKAVHQKYRGNGNPSSTSGTKRLAKIILYAPDLSREFTMRSSRDRIARGTIVNALVCALLVLPWWVGLPAVAVSISIWMMFEKLSYTFELCAEEVLDKKLQAVNAS